MFTDCPACERQFRIYAAQLQAAGGWVRCGFCGETFDALARLRDAPLKPDPSAPAAAAPITADDPTLALDDDLSEALLDEAQALEDGPSMMPAEVELPDAAAEASAVAESLPELAAEAENRRPAYNKPLWAGIVVALLALSGAQLAWFNRDPLLRGFPWLRPWAETLCARIECQVDRFRDIAAIELLEREVREHPRYQNSLIISATIINRAELAQPYPQLRLLIFDQNGRKVAYHDFAPNDYLDHNEMTVKPSMPPNLPVSFTTELSGTTESVVSYEFQFY